MLVDLVSSSPKDLACAIREFTNCTAMLRDCGFAHIGEMLARLLSADVQGGLDGDTTVISSTPVTSAAVVGRDPSSLTKNQAIIIGSAIASSVHQAHSIAAGLERVGKSHAILHVLKSKNAWFMPMLEVVMAHKAAKRRRSAVFESSISPVAYSGGRLYANAADEESGFSSVVRLGANGAPFCCPRTS
jgi:hypothetical protein